MIGMRQYSGGKWEKYGKEKFFLRREYNQALIGEDWVSFLQDDESENLTAMPNDKFFDLYHKWSKWASRYNAIRYLNYNLRRDFWGTIKEATGLIRRKLCKY